MPRLEEEIIAELLNASEGEEREWAVSTAELYLQQREWTRNSIDGHWQKAP
jgi:hypothetical protein